MVPLADISVVAGVDRALAVVRYDEVVASLIGQLKYRGSRAGVGWLGAAMTNLFQGAGEHADLVSWVPALARNRRRRGFDQGRLLAQEVARALSVPVGEVFARRGRTPQTGADRKRRLVGPEMSGGPAIHVVRGRAVLIVDDVTTTGASIAACAEIARAAGAERVIAIAAAHRP